MRWAALVVTLAALGFAACEKPGLGQSGAAIPIEGREPARSEATLPEGTVSQATVSQATASEVTVPGANGSVSPSPGAEGELREVVIVATSDLHGWITRDTLFPKGRPGGLAHLAPLIARLRQEHPHLILLDGGDTLQGAPNLTHRRQSGAEGPPAVLRLMERLGYDAMAVGNHDLEQGFRRIEGWAEASSFPWLAANVVGPDDAPVFPPYAMLERDGVRVAVLGMTTPGTPAWVDADFIAGLRFLGLPETARRWVDHLREVERADLVIGLFHSGLDGWYDRSMAVRAGLALPNAAGEIADRGSGFDLIVSGHAHRLWPRRPADGNTPYAVPVVQPGARGNGLAVVRFRLRGRPENGRWKESPAKPCAPPSSPTGRCWQRWAGNWPRRGPGWPKPPGCLLPPSRKNQRSWPAWANSPMRPPCISFKFKVRREEQPKRNRRRETRPKGQRRQEKRPEGKKRWRHPVVREREQEIREQKITASRAGFFRCFR